MIDDATREAARDVVLAAWTAAVRSSDAVVSHAIVEALEREGFLQRPRTAGRKAKGPKR